MTPHDVLRGMARAAPAADPLSPLRTHLTAGLVAAALALALAHAYRSLYLLAGGTDFAEVNAISTTLAAIVPVLLAAFAYRFAQAWLGRRARTIFTIGVLAFGILSAIPFLVAPPHPGFAALSAPLHVLVAATAAITIPAWVARTATRGADVMDAAPKREPRGEARLAPRRHDGSKRPRGRDGSERRGLDRDLRSK